ncbi:DUF7519 family protein [Haloferax larsenii]|uniref:Major facilitator superfamily (MFS) profile domain-containing protein n=1 Tax=Haloferax larsenii TaxID=302484 RepID=A0A1H7UNH2_HALLR|nr:hypothetical protein [Haloferax larsenii]SEL98346.1 hypothetical protein SAMN04488691_11354 [Haloferax larsenii]
MPPLLSSSIALVAAIGTAIVTAVSVYTVTASTLGVLILGAGLVRGSVNVYSAGTVLLVGAILFAGAVGMAPSFLLAASFLLLLSWNVGQNGFSIAREVGSDASTRRIELVHAISSSVVLAAGCSVGYAVFLSVTGSESVVALGALLVGVLALLSTLQGEELFEN